MKKTCINISLLFLFAHLSPVSATSLPRDADCLPSEPPGHICPGSHPADSTTGQRALNDAVYAQSQGISNAVTAAMRSRGIVAANTFSRTDGAAQTGIQAGDLFTNYSVWFSYSRTSTENTAFATEFGSDLDSFLGGIDFAPRENMILGIAFGHENNDINTTFNAGQQEVDGYTVAPYFGYLITPFLSLDASIGYSDLSTDQSRLDTIDLTSIITADTDSERWFFSANMNMFQDFNRFIVSGRAGILYAAEEKDDIVETGGPDAFTTSGRTVDFGQWHAGGEIAYQPVSGMEPYAGVVYEHDFKYEKLRLNPGLSPPANDRSGFRIGLGIRYFANDFFSANFEWNILAARDDFDSDTFSLIGRLDF